MDIVSVFEIRDVRVESEYAIATNNLDLLCFSGALPDYAVRYAEKGWCRVADVLAAAPTGECEAQISLDDGAAWSVCCLKTRPGALCDHARQSRCREVVREF